MLPVKCAVNRPWRARNPIASVDPAVALRSSNMAVGGDRQIERRPHCRRLPSPRRACHIAWLARLVRARVVHRASSAASGKGLPATTAVEAIQIKTDDRRGVERQKLAYQEPAHDGVAERLAQLRGGAVTEHERYSGEQGCQRRHQDRAEAQDARLADGLLRVRPPRPRSMAKSTTMMPFFFTMPMRRIPPISAMIEKSKWKAQRVIRAPMPAEGSVEIVNGWT
jgi:hypothetical protein